MPVRYPDTNESSFTSVIDEKSYRRLRQTIEDAEAKGAQVVPLVPVNAMNPIWAPDDSMILFEGPHVQAASEVVAITPDGQRIDSFPRTHVRPFSERLQFLPDGSGVVYLTGVNPHLEFHLLDLETGTSRKITELDDVVMHTFDITQDGKTIVFDRERLNADVVLIERAAAR